MSNTGQILLVLGALVLFSLMLPSINENILHTDRTLTNSNAEMTAMALAQKLISEAGAKSFDEVTLTTRPQTPNSLTAPASLGPESGEAYPNFDDIDDYNGLSIADSTTLPSVLFNISAVVNYISTANVNQVSGSQTFLKRLRVTVNGPYLVNPANETPTAIVLEQLFAFY